MVRPRKTCNDQGEWQCTLCKKWKAPDQYYKNYGMSNNLQTRCIDCTLGTKRGDRVQSRRDSDLVQLRLEITERYPNIQEQETTLWCLLQWITRAYLTPDVDFYTTCLTELQTLERELWLKYSAQ